MDERFYTPKQVADILQVHQYTILKWIREGKIRALKLGRVYRTTESELRAFLGQTAHDSAQEIMRSASYTPDTSMVQTSTSREPTPHISEPESMQVASSKMPLTALQSSQHAANQSTPPASTNAPVGTPESIFRNLTGLADPSEPLFVPESVSQEQPVYSLRLDTRQQT